VELGLLVDGAMKLMVAKLRLDRAPHLVRCRLGNTNDGANVLGDGVVQPAEDALVDHDPVGIMAVGGGRWRHKVGLEAELPDDRVEEAVPLDVVVVGEIEFHGDVVLYVHRLQHGGRWWLNMRLGEGRATIRRGGGGV
jgi:hypothetical protein